jgi:hypothetical protein
VVHRGSGLRDESGLEADERLWEGAELAHGGLCKKAKDYAGGMATSKPNDPLAYLAGVPLLVGVKLLAHLKAQCL